MSAQNDTLARLLTLQQSAYGETDATFAARFGKNWRTYFNWRTGVNAPTNRDHAAIEEGIGWKPGSIARALNGQEPFLTLADVQDLPAADRPVHRASELTDDELLSEVTRRFKNYADAVRQYTLVEVSDFASSTEETTASVHQLKPRSSQVSDPSRIDGDDLKFAARKDGEYEDGND